MVFLKPGAGGTGGAGTDDEGAGGGGDGSGGGDGGGGSGGPGNESGGGGSNTPSPAPLSFVGDSLLTITSSGTFSILVPQIAPTSGASGQYDVVVTLALAPVSSPTTFYDVASAVVGTLTAPSALGGTTMQQTLSLQGLPSGPYVAELVLGDAEGDAYANDVVSYLGTIPTGGGDLTLSDVPPPSAPTALAASAVTTSAVTLAWQPSTVSDGGAVSDYIVYANGAAIGTTTSTSFQVTQLASGTAYVFTVAAADIAGDSEQSAPIDVTTAITVPSTPTGLLSTKITSGGVSLAWSAASVEGGSVSYYAVMKNGSEIGTTTRTNYVVSELAPHTKYSFAIVAEDAVGASPASSALAVTTAVAIPTTPDGAEATSTTGGATTLDWQAASITGGGATPEYVILENGASVAATSALSVIITGLAPSTNYDFTVAAADASGASLPSLPIDVTTGTVTAPPSTALPDLSSFLSSISDAAVLTVSAALEAGTTKVHDLDVATGSSTVPAVKNALNAMAVTDAISNSTSTLGNGYRVGYILGGGPAALQDTTGGNLLVGVSGESTLYGADDDTLVGGEGNVTFVTAGTTGTIIGGTGANTMFLGAADADITSQGTDTIIGGSGSATVTALGSALYLGGPGTSDIDLVGSGTVIGGGAGSTVYGGTGNQVIFGSTSLTYVGSSGAATIIGGGIGNTVIGGSGNLLLFASSSLTYAGGNEAATVIGGSGPLDASIGAGGGIVYGSPGGDDTLTSGSGSAILVGGGTGDLLTVTGSIGDTLVAGSGAETLTGAGSSGNLVFFGGSGPDVEVGGTGNDLFVTSSADETLVGGGSSNDYLFANTPGTQRVDVIAGFNPATDAIGLFGYGNEPAADTAALASASASGSSTNITLPDGTTIVLVDTPSLHSFSFF
jgi:chitodextrinase